MSEPFEVGVKRRAVGDHYSDWIDDVQSRTTGAGAVNPLDSDKFKKLHQRLQDWYFHERSKQAENRLEMSLDADFYDGMQWSPEDAEEVKSRGQVPLVYNETAPMVDWLIGTERRTRVDWNVMPRTEDDVEGADAKEKVLKFISDINRTPFNRSRAFADSIKSGLGWVDNGARDDPTKDVIYDKYEDWRNVLHDSSGYDLDLEDSRYLFRWRWVDDDVAIAMFPERADMIRRVVVDAGNAPEAELDDFYMGEPITQSGSMYASTGSVFGEASRRRVRLIECQFRMPARSQIVADGPLKGVYINEHDFALREALKSNGGSIVDKVVMRTHFAVFIDIGMLAAAPSIYRHNRYTLTPLWCYRRGKDRMPYGVIRRIRDIQQDLNKRASKALFLLSTNQIIADKGAVEDPNVAREEADRPDGYIEKAPGKEFTLRRDSEAANGQIQMMTLDATTIQRSVGVNDENLGRKTNAISGEAIKARQIQGSVSTTEPFDNLRFAVQVQGEKVLSLSEQFYTDEKVIRLTGKRGKAEWLRINQPEVQADGSVRFINDMTAAAADFVVSEQDYAGTLRQVMFDSMRDVAGRLPPDLAVRFLRMAYEYSDMPNKDEIADEIRKITGERDPDKEMTPEEAQQMEQQMAQQMEAMQIQRESALAALEEQRAKVNKLNAEAAKIAAESGGGNGMDQWVEQALRQIQEQATAKLEAMAEQLRKVQAEAANKTLAIKSDADTKVEVARINAYSNERVAEINKENQKQFDAMEKRMADIAASVTEAIKRAQEAVSAADQASKKAEQASTAKATPATEQPAPAAAPAPQITVPITIESGAFQIDAKSKPANKTITMQVGGEKVTGSIKQDGGEE